MPTQGRSGKPTTRRYSDEEKAQAVRLVRQLRRELGTEHGTVKRVAEQLGYGVESVRSWVKQADIDAGAKPGVTTAEAERIKKLEQEVKELRRTNEILRKASAYFAQAELDRPWK
jgi:transposase